MPRVKKMPKIAISRTLIWFLMAVLVASVVVLWRGTAYRADGALDGTWDVQIIFGDSLANFLGWAVLVASVALLYRTWTERYLPETFALMAGAVAVLKYWSKELPGPPFYLWIIPVTAAAFVLADFFRGRSKRPNSP